MSYDKWKKRTKIRCASNFSSKKLYNWLYSILIRTKMFLLFFSKIETFGFSWGFLNYHTLETLTLDDDWLKNVFWNDALSIYWNLTSYISCNFNLYRRRSCDCTDIKISLINENSDMLHFHTFRNSCIPFFVAMLIWVRNNKIIDLLDPFINYNYSGYSRHIEMGMLF